MVWVNQLVLTKLTSVNYNYDIHNLVTIFVNIPVSFDKDKFSVRELGNKFLQKKTSRKRVKLRLCVRVYQLCDRTLYACPPAGQMFVQAISIKPS